MSRSRASSPDIDLALSSVTDPALTVTLPDTDVALSRPDTASTSMSPDTEFSSTEPLRYVAVSVPPTVTSHPLAQTWTSATSSKSTTTRPSVVPTIRSIAGTRYIAFPKCQDISRLKIPAAMYTTPRHRGTNCSMPAGRPRVPAGA